MGDSGSLSLRGWAVIVLVLLIMVFALQNTGVVEVRFLFWSAALSMFMLLLGALAAGALAGFFLGRELFGRKK
jgi:uncharacterized integral membrane protein